MELNDLHFTTGPVGPITPRVPVQAPGSAEVPTPSFGSVLDTKEREVKFSGHALARLKFRNIEMNSARMDRLSEAIDRASAKGSRDSLILMDDTAFVVSVKNRTVITAVDGASLKENVFTKIDSAVIV